MPHRTKNAHQKNRSLSIFSSCFSTLTDPRRTTKGNLRYPIEEILFLTISACISGANSWTAIEAFGECFMNWVNSVHRITDGLVVALDGKTVRGFIGTDKKSALHIVSAYSSMHRITLGQTVVDEKSNEITAIPKLLDLLTLTGCIVTIDAMGCQKEIARKRSAESRQTIF